MFSENKDIKIYFFSARKSFLGFQAPAHEQMQKWVQTKFELHPTLIFQFQIYNIYDKPRLILRNKVTQKLFDKKDLYISALRNYFQYFKTVIKPPIFLSVKKLRSLFFERFQYGQHSTLLFITIPPTVSLTFLIFLPTSFLLADTPFHTFT